MSLNIYEMLCIYVYIYYILADLLYNILKIDEQATKYKITHTETSNGLYGGQKMKFAEPNFF